MREATRVSIKQWYWTIKTIAYPGSTIDGNNGRENLIRQAPER